MWQVLGHATGARSQRDIHPTTAERWCSGGPGTPPGTSPLSLGNGIVVSTDYNAHTHRYQAGTLSAGPITDLDKWGPRLGWRAPNFRVGSESA